MKGGRTRWRRAWGLLLALALAWAAGCSRRDPGEGPLVMGFFPTITHAQALVGAHDGTFARQLPVRPPRMRAFNAGPEAMEALLAGELDVAYVGPGPAIVAHVRTGGRVKVIAGAASGGAGLVVKGLARSAELRGQFVRVPQIGNSQDIALRTWLQGQGLAPAGAGGDVEVIPLPNPEMVNLFRLGELKAAWVVEPWIALLLREGATLLVDERSLWPGGRFPTTVLVATDRALRERREEVKAVLRAHLELTGRARRDPSGFQEETNAGFEALTRKKLEDEVVRSAFSRLELLADPMADQLLVVAGHAVALGYVPAADMSGLVDGSLLEELEVPAASGQGGAGPQPGG